MSNLIAVYGSLRKGEYNQEGRNGMKYLSTHEIDGYELYSFGSYPGIKEGKGKLTVDIFECTDQCKKSIDWMEIGAGYVIKPITIEGKECDLYVYNHDVEGYTKVESGDWSTYLKNKKNERVLAV